MYSLLLAPSVQCLGPLTSVLIGWQASSNLLMVTARAIANAHLTDEGYEAQVAIVAQQLWIQTGEAFIQNAGDILFGNEGLPSPQSARVEEQISEKLKELMYVL